MIELQENLTMGHGTNYIMERPILWELSSFIGVLIDASVATTEGKGKVEEAHID